METFYKKTIINGKAKYVPWGIDVNVLPPGLWLIQEVPGIKSHSNVLYKIGDIPRADALLHVNIQQYEDRLTHYMAQVMKEDSPEREELIQNKIINQGFSISDITTILLRKLAILIQEDNEKSKT